MPPSTCKGCGKPLDTNNPQREWCNNNCRRRHKYRHGCLKCGGFVSRYADGLQATRLCLSCAREERAKLDRMVRDTLAREWQAMWAAGMSSVQIAEAAGWKPRSVQVHISRLRGLGYDFPYRRPQMFGVARRSTEMRKQGLPPSARYQDAA